ncbi:MAG: hypothetical protein FJZ16_04420 [Candidatus Omnitrophica bacterium]|nr:hypothetical protein [Candidatus Omnitrophota bacterium]
MRLCLIGIICFLFFGCVNSFAEMVPGHSWGIGTELSHIKYEEPGIMEEEGLMYGMVGFYTYRGGIEVTSVEYPQLDQYIFKVDGRLSLGQVDYKNSGQIDSIDDFIMELRGLGGLGFSICERIIISPYVGIGYRYLNDDMGGEVSTTGAQGYERESNYLYSPIGIEGELDLDNNWSVGATAEYDLFWFGKQISHLSNINPGFNDPENRQHKGFGLRGALRVKKKGEKIDFIFEPFIRFWKIKTSQEADWTYLGAKIGITTEPKNKSTEYGAKFAIKF